ncbi:type II toxin-antitoxin system RelE/ParE family toxin [Hyphobacterium sp.]|jgi:proteic killer suppression protein|uniref:type II toxin-antitoxin system RelE/ParE family toxin n=1 Tax=Hyphobacterium sp. TaxID=2004662 RepID=UPI003BA92AC1
MIVSWHDKTAKVFFETGRIGKRAGWKKAARVVARKLDMLNAAHRLDDLVAPPGNRLEALSGDRAGQHSIRINDQWRICFVWRNGAHGVQIVDYH